MIKVLINDSFKKFLIQQPPDYRRKVRQKFEYLEIGYWEGGLKVKKIKSIASNKTIFEARLDRANRILFTMGSEPEIGAPGPALLIYVWGIVSHDDISRGSKNIPANVPFLQFKPFQEESIAETLLEDLEPSYRSQENITQKVLDDSATQRWYFLNEENWQRIEDYRQEDFELALYLTPEQEEIMNKPLPMMVSGTAGSGKTTLGIYYLLKLSLAEKKKLFITYNQFLRNSAARLFHALLNATPWAAEMKPPDFFTFKEYCLKAAESYHRQFPLENEVNFERFQQLIRPNSQARKFDPPLIWEEIRSMIKGALPQINLNVLKRAHSSLKSGQVPPALLNAVQQQLFAFSQMESLKKLEKFVQKYLQTDLLNLSKHFPDYADEQSERALMALEKMLEVLLKERELTQKKYLSFMDYEALGRKKAPNFLLDRSIIYGIFEWYQEQLDRQGLWDELDLSREVVTLLSEHSAEASRYDVVVCDEVQDLTDVQHELLFHVTRSPLDLLLSGDTKQIINPSGFRWEELKRHFYERELKIPEIHFLNLNFRSSGSIVELSNLLLELKFNLLGVRAEELMEDWKYKGRPPVVVRSVGEPEMLENVQSTGARRTILVRSEAEKNRLRKSLETELVFTIYEAKGLEFDTVLLWKFASDAASSDVWKVILSYSNREMHQAKIRHEINLLYVAITRAQKDLLIYDGEEPSFIWDSEAIRPKIYATGDLAYIGKIWEVVSTPEEWREQGDYFFEREFYRAALECYKNAGEDRLVLKAKAYYAEKTGDFAAAGSYFEQIGELKKAASFYEKSGQYDKALRAWKEMQNEENVFRCQLKLLEQKGQFEELGEIYLSRKEYRKAVEMLVKGGVYAKAAQVSLNHLKDRKNAAPYYERAGMHREAAELYAKLKQWEKAAELYERAREYEAAIKLWKKLKRKNRLIPLYEQTGNYTGLLELYEKAKDFDNALKTLKKMPGKADLRSEAAQLLEKRQYFPALLRFYLLNDHSNIAACSYRLREYARAARHYELAGEHYAAGNAYQKIKDRRAALANYLLSAEDRQNNFSRARRIVWRFPYPEIEEEGHRLRREKHFEAAAFCFSHVFKNVLAGICCLEGNLKEAALKYWRNSTHDTKMLEQIARYCLQNHLEELGAQCVLSQPVPRYNYFFHGFDFQAEIPTALIEMMDRYFQDNPKREEMKKWANHLDRYRHIEEIEWKRLEYLEKSGDYNSYFTTLARYARFRPAALEHFKNRFRRESEQSPDEISEISAIRFYFLKQDADFNRVVRSLELTEDNYEIFAHSERWEEAIRMLIENGQFEQARWILVDRREFLALAKLFQERGDISSAAHYYGVAGDDETSAALFESNGEFIKSGDAYYKARRYQKALEMYQKSGRGKTKIAQTYEKLGDYAKAAQLWKELGKPKKAQKCLEKLPSPGIFK